MKNLKTYDNYIIFRICIWKQIYLKIESNLYLYIYLSNKHDTTQTIVYLLDNITQNNNNHNL